MKKQIIKQEFYTKLTTKNVTSNNKKTKSLLTKNPTKKQL